MTAERWDRLATTLAEAGVDAKVHTLGQGSYGITLRRLPYLVEIHDKYWRKNINVWVGWQVHVEGPDGFVVWSSATTKKRGEVRDAVQAALVMANQPDAPCAICREPFTAIRHRGVSARYGHQFTPPSPTTETPYHDAEALVACGLTRKEKS